MHDNPGKVDPKHLGQRATDTYEGRGSRVTTPRRQWQNTW